MKLTVPLGVLASIAVSGPGLAQVSVPVGNPQASAQGVFSVDPVTGQPQRQDGGIYKNVTGNATTVVKTGAGFLHSVTLNTLAASETIGIYDNTAGNGTLIANITGPSTITGVDPITLTYDSAFSTGLTVVTAGGAATNVTVSYH